MRSIFSRAPILVVVCAALIGTGLACATHERACVDYGTWVAYGPAPPLADDAPDAGYELLKAIRH